MSNQTTSGPRRLEERHYKELTEGSGIDPELVRRRGYRTVTDPAELRTLGFGTRQAELVPGLLIPQFFPTNGQRPVSYQFKPDRPRLDENTGKPVKYETPPNGDASSPGVHLDLHPANAEEMKDRRTALYITEGLKKGDALTTAGACAVTLQGVWCWRSKRGKRKGPLPEWKKVPLRGRKVRICFDSDVTTNPNVRGALEELSGYLRYRQAEVKVIYLPPTEDGGKVGVDDWLLANGGDVERLEELAVELEDGPGAELQVGMETKNPNKGITAITAITAVPNKLPTPEAFPVDAMPRGCRQLIREAAAAIGCPPEFVALPMLAVLGSAIGNSRVLKLKEGWEEAAGIYAAVIADPGEKKTPAYKVAIEPATKRQAAFRDEYQRKVDEYNRDLREYEVDKQDAKKAKEAAPPPPLPPTMSRTVVEDTTVEALAVVLESTPRGVLAVRDELTGWVRSMDQYKQGGRGSDRQFWLSAWSNGYVAVDRKSRGEPLILTRPFVGVFGSIQPGVLGELGAGREDGLLDRFIFAYPTPMPSRWSDDEISPLARETYRRLYDALRDNHMPTDDHGDPEPVRIHFSPDARTVFVDSVNAHREEMEAPGFPARLKGPWSKLEAYLARISLIIATARAADTGQAERVEAEDVLRAVVLVGYLKSHARRVYVGLHGEDPLDRLAEDLAVFLKNHGGSWEGQPTPLHEALQSEYKPPTPEALTRKLRTLTKKHPALVFDSGDRWVPELGNKRRFVKLCLEDGGNGGNSGNGQGGG